MKNLNIVVSDVEEQRTLNGTKSTEKVLAYVGNITPAINSPEQDPMYLNAFEITTLPPEIEAKLRANADRRITESSLARRQQRVSREQVQETNR